MIRNPALVESFERSLTRGEAADYRRNLRIFEALYREARTRFSPSVSISLSNASLSRGAN